MNKITKQLIILYIIIVILKISLAYFILAPSSFSDYYGYAKVARNLFYHGTFTVHDDISTRPPLYSLVLSLAYIFKDMEIVYFFMKVLNAMMSSLIIFPAWLLSKEFFNKKKAMLLTTMIAVLPANFGFTFLLMAENLFYPLFLFSIYFIYKSFIEESCKWDILAGIFIGLAYLTKIHAIILPLVVIFVFLFRLLKKDHKEIWKKILMSIFFLITISPFLIRNSLISGFNKDSVLSSYGGTLEGNMNTLTGNPSHFLIGFLIWFMLYLSYLMIASGFIFFIANLTTFKNFNNKKLFTFSSLTFFSTIFLTFLASRHFHLVGVIDYQTIFSGLIGNGRILGRYVEALIPLILINGLIGFKYLKKISRRYIIIPTIILIFSTQLVFFQLFPINNMSLAWLGVLKFIFDFLIFQKISFETIFSPWYSIVFITLFVVILLSTIYLQRKISTKSMLCIFIIFFSLVSLLNFCIIYYNTNTFWYNSEQTQLGLWFNKYDSEISTILFDERDGCKIFKTNQTCIYNPFSRGGSATIIGFWMNDEIRVGPVDKLDEIDYVISKHKLDLSLLKETKNGIFLYQVI